MSLIRTRHEQSLGGLARCQAPVPSHVATAHDEELALARRAVALGRQSSPSQITALQGVAGNRAMQRLLDGPGISDDAAEGVGAMLTRAERSARPADNPGISDDTAESVGAMLTRAARQERAARAVQADPLNARQAAAARDYQDSRELRQASWESQVKATHDIEQTRRLAPGQKLSGEEKALRFGAFVAKCDAEAERLSTEAAKADKAKGDAGAALEKTNAASLHQPFLTYQPATAATMINAKTTIAHGIGELAAKAAALRSGLTALTTARNNTTYSHARRLTIDSGWLDRLAKSVKGLEAHVRALSLEKVRTVMKGIITDEWTKPERLAPTWAEKEKRKVASLAADKIPDKTAFEAGLAVQVQRQHNPTKSEWLEWLKRGLGWDKWRHGLWGADTVGTVAEYNVHATRFLTGWNDANSMRAPSVDAPATDMYEALLGSGVEGFHVTMEVHGEMGTPTQRNPHSYRRGPSVKNDYVNRGVPWAEARVALESLRNATVTRAEARIKALKDVHGER